MGDDLSVDGLVLKALADGAATGRAISAAAGRGIPVHRTLRRFERDGLVRSAPLPRAKRRQRLYRLTRSGEEALAAWRLTALSLARAGKGARGGSLASGAWPSRRPSTTSPT
jgi:DNA-binding PadR family transcriptional regulator